jgi:hypothetical protein
MDDADTVESAVAQVADGPMRGKASLAGADFLKTF